MNKNVMKVPALLIGVVALVEAYVALSTESQTAMIISLGLFFGALSLWPWKKRDA